MSNKIDCRLKKNKSKKKCLKKSKKSPNKEFFFNPNNPKISFDVYINKNPSDTISIKYTTIDDIKKTIKKLEKLYKNKSYSHKRIWQVAMIMKVRLDIIKKYNPNVKNIKSRLKLATKYYNFLKNRTTKKTFIERKKLIFSL